ncbi:MAG: hypothetical protein LQ342_004723 [Letrouitia transgressa]|nr:MAG: hypothetical protein LQ342_004723 [Letrouitia transgressa]
MAPPTHETIGNILWKGSDEAADLVSRGLEERQFPGVIDSNAFLRRAYQASTVAGDWLYIDGGEFAYTNQGNTLYRYSTTLLSVDLSKDWNNATLVIKSTSKPSGVPNLSQGSLWYDEKSGLLYTGFTGRSSNYNSPQIYPMSLWSFKPDGTGSGSWNEEINSDDPVWNKLTRPVRGFVGQGAGNAFVLSGVAMSLTSQETQDAENDILLPGLVQFNMTTKKFTNSTARGYSYNQTAQNGGMHYVPSFGPSGLYVVMGGVNITDGDDWNIPFDNISVYDPENGKWFNQTATGNIPEPRREFCLAGVNSTNGTYEIFLYGGDNGNLGSDAIPYDEIFILTLPAFNWIRVDYPPEHPRAGHSCNAVGGSQIISIGGFDANAKVATGYFSDIYQSILNSSADPNTQGIGIFDMTTLTWADSYRSKAGEYEQSELVKAYYANNPLDGSQLSSDGLRTLFQTTHFSDAPASQSSAPPPITSVPPPPPSSGGTNTGAIAGGVVGGVAGLAAVAGLLFFFLRRRRQRKEKVYPRPRTPELSTTQTPVGLNGNAGPGGFYEPPKRRFGEMANEPLVEMEGARPEMEGGGMSPREMEGEGHGRL